MSKPLAVAVVSSLGGMQSLRKISARDFSISENQVSFRFESRKGVNRVCIEHQNNGKFTLKLGVLSTSGYYPKKQIKDLVIDEVSSKFYKEISLGAFKYLDI